MRVQRLLPDDLAVVLHIPAARERRFGAGDMVRDGTGEQLAAHQADELGQKFCKGRTLHRLLLH